MRAKFNLKIILVVVLLICVCLAFISCKKTPPTDDPGEDTPSIVYIVKNGESEYNIIFDKDDAKGGTYAYALNQALLASIPTSDDSAAEAAKEILLGDTGRQLSKDLKADAESKYASDSHIWGFAYKNEQFAFYFNSSVAFDKGLAMLKSAFITDGVFSVAENTWQTHEFTKAAYDAEVKAEEERLEAEAAAKKKEELAKREAAAKAELAKFTGTQFGVTADWKTKYSMPTDVYPDPLSSITEKHPRVMLTSDEIPKIKTLLKNPEYENMAKNLWALADSENFTGIFTEKTHKSGETYRYSETVLAQIEARAMAYLITGEKGYAYEAIMGIKNAMLSLKFTTENHMDVYHGPSHVMFILAEVYDWCYDVLSEDDKAQLISGCVYLLINAEHLTDADFVVDANKPSNKKVTDSGRKPYGLEFNFPPNNYNAVTGHGPGPQFLRDYMMVTMAFADEVPSWWDYVGGRFYKDYLPVAELLYENGNVSQGTSCYAPIRIHTNLIPAYLIKTATGVNPYGDKLEDCSNFMLSHLMGNNMLFETGDGPRTGYGSSVVYCYFYLFGALYNDTFSLSAAKYYSNDYANYTADSIYTMCPGLTLALCAACDEASGNYPDDMPLITYTGYPVGQTTIRNSWKSDAAIVFMKINERTLAAHDLMDSGTFQIYHKGFLACTSGKYANYGSEHHGFYLQSTVSMNGLLIYNPSIANQSSYKGWYSGSQNKLSSATTIEQLKSYVYNVAKVVGVENAYNGKNAHYAYLAGDITGSYNSLTVDEVERRMLSVYTGDATFPMIFFVYDNITSTDSDYKKSFLLHTVKEPTIAGTATDKSFTVTPDESGKMTATVINGDGKLVLTNVIGGDYMHKIGGEGYAYWIGNENEFDGTAASGKNLLDDYVTSDNADTIWGRIEITARGERTSQMLNTMYVTDKSTTEALDSVAINTAEVAGATVGNVCAVFVRESVRRTSALEFTTTGTGDMKYYISGMYQGTWNVLIEGVKVGEVKATEDGGFLHFTAKAGNVKLTPGDDIIPEGHSFITYDVNGGSMPTEYPTTYEEGVGLELKSIIPSHLTHKFGGWYFDSELTNPAYIIDSSKTGNIKLYAKWHNGLINYDFTSGEKEQPNISFHEKGGSLEIATDAEGKKYLQWIQGPEDSHFNATNSTNNFSTITDPNSQVSLTFDIAKVPEKDTLSARVLIIAGSKNGGGDFYVFRIDGNGDVLLANNENYNLGRLTEEGMTLRILLDWKNETLTAYDAEGEILAGPCAIALPAAAAAQNYTKLDDWRREKLLEYNLYFHATANQEGKALRINSISYFEGNNYEKVEIPTLDPEIRYNLSGGTLPSGAPKVYTEGQAFDLTGIVPSHTLKIFAGWYFDEALTEVAKEIPSTATGNVQLYAKWVNKFLDVDFSKETVNGSNGSMSENSTPILFQLSQKPTASFITKTDGEGKAYLEWSRGEIDSFMYLQDGTGANNFAAMQSDDHTVSLEFDLGMIDGKAAISARYLLIVPGADGGESINVFQIKPNGDVVLNNENNGAYTAEEVICNIQNGAKIRISVDFKNAKFTAYREDGTTVVKDIVLPESVRGQFASVDAWREGKLSKYLLYFHGFGTEDLNCALRVNRITIVDGNIYG